MKRYFALLEMQAELHKEMKEETKPKRKELLKFQRDEIIKVMKVEAMVNPEVKEWKKAQNLKKQNQGR